MEKDNDSKEESSDYSCSPVTKNELLIMAKYRAIKFAIFLVLAISISLFLFICSKSLSRLLRVLQWKTKNEKKIPLLPPSILENFQFFETSSFPFLFPSIFLHSYVLFIIFMSLVILVLFSYINPKFVLYRIEIVIVFLNNIFIFITIIVDSSACS